MKRCSVISNSPFIRLRARIFKNSFSLHAYVIMKYFPKFHASRFNSLGCALIMNQSGQILLYIVRQISFGIHIYLKQTNNLPDNHFQKIFSKSYTYFVNHNNIVIYILHSCLFYFKKSKILAAILIFLQIFRRSFH